MKRIFADTSYWIALFNPRDELHARAVAAAQSYSDDQIVTSEMVLAEFLNGFSDRWTSPPLRGRVESSQDSAKQPERDRDTPDERAIREGAGPIRGEDR